MKRDAEVLVVGGGPAGAATALLLARAGRDVMLLDRAAFPRPKPCGDCLSVGATALLRRLELLPDVLAAAHGRIDGWRIVAPDGSAFAAEFAAEPRGARAPGDVAADTALSIERCVLDDVVLRAAQRAGVRVRRATAVDVLRSGTGRVTGVRTRARDYTAAVTVGADGLRSVIANRLGARGRPGALRKVSLTYHLPIAGIESAGEMHLGDGICAGVAPVAPSGRCNLTIVADADRYGRVVAASPAAFARAALAALPALRGRVRVSDLDAAAPLASGPFHRPVRRVAFDGAALIGDAAGYFDPFTGQGVHQALASAELLAPCINDALDSTDGGTHALRSWTRAHAALLRGARLVQHAIEVVTARPALAALAVRRIGRAPSFARTLLAVTGDAAPPHALLSPRLALELLFPLLPEHAA
jgi:flavin-dependent dehydrogenase